MTLVQVGFGGAWIPSFTEEERRLWKQELAEQEQERVERERQERATYAAYGPEALKWYDEGSRW